jgi:hypothetical protein
VLRPQSSTRASKLRAQGRDQENTAQSSVLHLARARAAPSTASSTEATDVHPAAPACGQRLRNAVKDELNWGRSFPKSRYPSIADSAGLIDRLRKV